MSQIIKSIKTFNNNKKTTFKTSFKLKKIMKNLKTRSKLKMNWQKYRILRIFL